MKTNQVLSVILSVSLAFWVTPISAVADDWGGQNAQEGQVQAQDAALADQLAAEEAAARAAEEAAARQKALDEAANQAAERAASEAAARQRELDEAAEQSAAADATWSAVDSAQDAASYEQSVEPASVPDQAAVDETSFPAATFVLEVAGGTLTIDVPEGCLPEGTRVHAEDVAGADAEPFVALLPETDKAGSEAADTFAVADPVLFELSFVAEDAGRELFVAPKAQFSVTFSDYPDKTERAVLYSIGAGEAYLEAGPVDGGKPLEATTAHTLFAFAQAEAHVSQATGAKDAVQETGSLKVDDGKSAKQNARSSEAGNKDAGQGEGVSDKAGATTSDSAEGADEEEGEGGAQTIADIVIGFFGFVADSVATFFGNVVGGADNAQSNGAESENADDLNFALDAAGKKDTAGNDVALLSASPGDTMMLFFTVGWDDDADRYGQRTATTIDVYQVVDDTVTFLRTVDVDTAEYNNVTPGIVMDLPIFDDNGEAITYRAVLNTPDGYTATTVTSTASPVTVNGNVGELLATNADELINGSYSGGFVFTATYETSWTSITINKVWDDSDNAMGIRPDRTRVYLKNNGTTVADSWLGDYNGWTATFNNLPKNDGVDAIDYYVEEGPVPGYTSTAVEKEEDAAGNTITFTVTNTLEVDPEEETRDITVTKVWNDDGDRDGIRPESVTVGLRGDGGNVGTFELTEEHDWTQTLTVPLYESGTEDEISYSVVESEVEGYTSEVTGSVEDGFTIANTHEPETVEIDVKKVWDDDGDRDGLRPETVYVRVLANGTYVRQRAITEAGGWSTTIAAQTQYKYENGEEIEYTLVEASNRTGGAAPIGGYTSEIAGSVEDGFTITNTHEPETRDITVEKVWDDADDQDGIRPERVTVTLRGNGGNAETFDLTREGGWKKTVTVPVYEGGVEISYALGEDEVDGYTIEVEGNAEEGFTVTNTHVPETTMAILDKYWGDDDNRDGARPERVRFTLLADGAAYAAHTLDVAGGESVYAFENLPKYREGEEIVYTIVEEGIEGYTSTVRQLAFDDLGLPAEERDRIIRKLEVDLGFVTIDSNVLYFRAINAHTPGVRDVTVVKVWEDEDDQDGIRPASVQVDLLADGEPVRGDDGALVAATLDGSNGWTYTFHDLPVYTTDDTTDPATHGAKVAYSVRETLATLADGTPLLPEGSEDSGVFVVDAGLGQQYRATYTDLGGEGGYITVTNTYEPKTIDLDVIKLWFDARNWDGVRPTTIHLQLTANGVPMPGKELTLSGSQSAFAWQGRFKGLPVFDGGEYIDYDVVEETPTGYSVDEQSCVSYDTAGFADDGVDKRVVVANSHIGDTVGATVHKVWDDANDQDGIRDDARAALQMGLVAVVGGAERPAAEVSAAYLENLRDSYIQFAQSYEEFDSDAERQARIASVEDYYNGLIQALGETPYQEQSLAGGDNLLWSSEALPANYLGRSVTYRAVELVDDDATDDQKAAAAKYAVTVEQVESGIFNVTNTYEPETRDITVKKVWDDADDQDGVRPGSLAVTVAGTVEGDTGPVTVYEENFDLTPDMLWKHVFEDLPAYSAGSEISYTVTETVPEGYATTDGEGNDVEAGATASFAVAGGASAVAITNTHEPETTDVFVVKQWDDSGNQDGLRPESVRVTLLADGVAYAAKAIDSTMKLGDDYWYYTFEDLPRYNKGEEIAYTLVEESVENYTVAAIRQLTYEEVGALDPTDRIVRELSTVGPVQYFEVVNAYAPETRDVTVVKVWEDEDDQDGVRPASVQVDLYADGQEVRGGDGALVSATLDASNGWTYTFHGLPVYSDGGERVAYSVRETLVTLSGGEPVLPEGSEDSGVFVVDAELGQSYTASYTDLGGEGGYITVTNTHEPMTFDLPVTKTWLDMNNWDGIRPASLRLQLTANGKLVEGREVVLTGYGYQWQDTFADLPVYENGRPIVYSVLEDVPEGYSATITAFDAGSIVYAEDVDPEILVHNSHYVEYTTVTATKIWDDEDDRDGFRTRAKEGLELALQASVNGAEYQAAEVVFDEIIEEARALINYIRSLSYLTDEEKDAYEEQIWQDIEDSWGSRSGRKDLQIALADLTDDQYVWDNLPANWNGKPVSYRVVERVKSDATEDAKTAAEAYTASINEVQPGVYEVTNTHKVDTVNIVVTKLWDDNDDQDSVRPENVRIQLMKATDAGGAAVGDPVSLAAPDWQYTFKDVPKNENGTLVKYYINEIVTPALSANYKTTYQYGTIFDPASGAWTEDASDAAILDNETEDAEEYFVTVKNEHEIEKITLPITKEWDDESDQDGERPDSIDVYILQNGQALREVQLTTSDAVGSGDVWQTTIEDLPLYVNGEEAVYTIAERQVDHYTTQYFAQTPERNEAGIIVSKPFRIVNTHSPDMTSVTVVKSWDDDNDRDGIRPDSVTVKLHGTSVDDAGNVVDQDTIEAFLVAQDEPVELEAALNLADGWTHVYSPLPVNYQSHKITYTVDEETDLGEDYTSSVVDMGGSGYITITNTHEPKTVGVKVQKVWNDADDQDGLRPDTVNIRVYADDELVRTSVLSGGNDGWERLFEGLPMFKQEGGQSVPVVYRVEEEGVDGYAADISYDASDDGMFITCTITNTHEPKLVDVTAEKVWSDADDQDGIRAAAAQAFLLQLTMSTKGQMPVPATVAFEDSAYADNAADATITGQDSLYTWAGLPTYWHGEAVTYSVVEFLDYNAEEDARAAAEQYTANVAALSGNYIRVTNVHEPDTRSISATKLWDDAGDQDGLRPSALAIEVQGSVDALPEPVQVVSATATLNEAGLWSHTFQNLPVNFNGQPIEYTVSEVVPAGYETVVANETTPAAGEGDAEAEPVVVGEGDVATFAVAADVDSLEFTNTHVPETTAVVVEKVWDDQLNQDGVRPDLADVRITLFAGDVEYAAKSLAENVYESEAQAVVTFEDLPRFADGKEINYRVVESSLADYTVTINELTFHEIDDADISDLVMRTYVDEDGGVEDLMYFRVTNTHVPGVRDVTVAKSWDDEDDADGVRPANVIVQLLADGQPATDADGNALTATLRASNGWTHTFAGVPVNSASDVQSDSDNPDATVLVPGSPIVYSVVETAVVLFDGTKVAPEIGKEGVFTVAPGMDYRASYTDLADEGGFITVTNTHEVERVALSVNKLWNDADDNDGVRPEAVRVQLSQLTDDGAMPLGSPTVLSGPEWSYTFENLPRYDSEGKLAHYFVHELESDQLLAYSTDYVYGLIAGTLDDVAWDASPESVVSFEAEGESTYYVTIRNTHEVAMVEPVVVKVWDDASNQDGARPETARFSLVADGRIEQVVELSREHTIDKDTWAGGFAPVRVFDDGKQIAYSIVEGAVDGYTTDIKELTLGEAADVLGLGEDQGMSDIVDMFVDTDVYPDVSTAQVFQATNTSAPGTTAVSATKVWVDEDDTDGIRPARVSVTLVPEASDAQTKEAIDPAILQKYVEDKGATTTAVLWDSNGWSYNFEGLPTHYDGNPIGYSLVETDVPAGYAASYSDLAEEGSVVVTNTHEVKRTSHTVTIKWDDNDNQDGNRPDYVNVYLTRDGQRVSDTPVTLSAANGWTYTWTDLPASVFEDGVETEAVYGSDEITPLDPASYTRESVTDDADTNTTTIVNAYTPQTIAVTGHKIWDDADNQDGARPESVTVNLYANGNLAASKQVTAADATKGNASEWNYSFTDLPRYADGQLVQYNVSETSVDNYTLSIKGYDLVNTYTPGKTFTTVIKLWDDGANRDGVRPDNVIVRLQANGTEVDRASLSAASGWIAVFNNLDINAEGQEVAYAVTEDAVEGYTATVAGNRAEGFVITNTHAAKTTEFAVAKVWDDNDNADGKRPASIVVDLLASGTVVDSKVLTSETGWKATFTGLPANSGGSAVSYTVAEQPVTGYAATVSGHTITNKPVSSDATCVECKNTTSTTNATGGSTTATPATTTASKASVSTADTAPVAVVLFVLLGAICGLLLSRPMTTRKTAQGKHAR